MQDILVNRLIASGFWQIQMHPNSREKTAFITPHGLYESRLHAGDRCIYPGARCQVQPDNQLHIQLHMQTEHYTSEKRYGITESETLTGCSLGYIPLSSLFALEQSYSSHRSHRGESSAGGRQSFSETCPVVDKGIWERSEECQH